MFCWKHIFESFSQGLFLRRAAAQYGLDARLELARREWLGHVIVDPGLETRDPIGFVASRGHHDDGELPSPGGAAQGPRKREAGWSGQHPVEKQQVRQGGPDGRRPGRCRAAQFAAPGQSATQAVVLAPAGPSGPRNLVWQGPHVKFTFAQGVR